MKKKAKRTAQPTALGWVGLVHDGIDLEYSANTADYGRIYRTRAEAKNRYTAVRRVRIVVIGR